MLPLVLVAVVLSTAGAQPSREDCCWPEAFEGYNSAVVGFAMSSGSDAMTEGIRAHIDYRGKRVATSVYQHFERTGDERQYRTIDNYETKKRILVENNECRISELSGELANNCIHETHVHEGTYHIGAGEDILLVDSWRIPTNYSRDEMHLRTVRLGETACVPYQYRRIFVPTEAEEGHPAFMSFHSYTRITEGIEDDSVFHTPEECQAVDKVDIPLVVEEALKMFQAN